MLVTVVGIEEDKAKFCCNGACVLVEEIHNGQMKEGEEGRKGGREGGKEIQMIQGGKFLSERRVPTEREVVQTAWRTDASLTSCHSLALSQLIAASLISACSFSPL